MNNVATEGDFGCTKLMDSQVRGIYLTAKFFTVLHGPTFPMAFLYTIHTVYTIHSSTTYYPIGRTSQPVKFIG